MLIRNLTTSWANNPSTVSMTLEVDAYRVLEQAHAKSTDNASYRVLWEGNVKSGLAACALYMEEWVVGIGSALQV